MERKLLPFKKKFKYTLNTDNVDLIKQQLSKMPVKIAVIDDAGYLLTNTFMRGHSAGRKGSQTFDLYNDIADQYWGLFKHIKNNLPEDVIVYIIMHEDTNDSGVVKLKTIGKLLDDKVCLEGMSTIVLRCQSEEGKHFFRTTTDGWDITKAPEEMFPNEIMENDLKKIDELIREYYGWNTESEVTDSEDA